MNRVKFVVTRSLLLASSLLLLSTLVSADSNMTILPNWSLSDASGNSVDYYADSKQSVSIILFWATWCPYCRSLMPHLQEVIDEYKNRPVKFYALNVWEDGDPEKYFEENGFTFHLLLQADSIAESYGVKGTPGLFVSDLSHQVLYMRQSGEDDFDVKIAVREAIEQALSSAQQ